MTHQIQTPPYPLEALEPWFDKTTMDLHVHKHHQTYADKLNVALEDHSDLQSKSLEDLIKLTSKDRSLITNMAGGVINHNFFWTILSPEFNQAPSEALSRALAQAFDSPEVFVDKFTQSATSLFGSGWTWLTYDHQSGLEIINLPNQENPLSLNKTPLLALDLWEHAYYLKYQNRRPEYIAAFWHLVNWKQVDTYYQQTK